MLLDKYLIKNLKIIGAEILNKAGLIAAPRNIGELHRFFNTLKIEAEYNNNPAANMIYQVLYNFVSSVEVRDRHTSPREFEDIFSSIFDTISTDVKSRENPLPSKEIIKYDIFSKNQNWSISTDLCGNKREKADVSIGGYCISLKTLKGKCYDNQGVIIDKDFNNELNVGSFSYRALFKGILTDDQLMILNDRKGGLGSGRQMRKFVLEPIKDNRKEIEFLNRLRVFLSYVYEEDLLIVIKSGYRMDLYFIPNKTFTRAICCLYEHKEFEFEKLWYRWENNNLRLNLSMLFNCFDNFNLLYKKMTLNLGVYETQNKISTFNRIIGENIESELKKIII